MIRNFAYSLLALGLMLFNRPLYAQDAPAQGWIMKPIEPEKARIFMERVFDGKTLDLPEEVQSLPADKMLSDVWMGNKPVMTPNVKSIRLNFSRREEDSSTTSYFIEVEFPEKSLIIRHSNARYPAQRGGFRFQKDRDKDARKFVYRGQGQQGIVLLIPKIDAAKTQRGIVVCPRDFMTQKKEGYQTYKERSSLHPSGYVLTSASAQVEGSVQAQLRNKLDFVMARVKLISSEGVLPAINTIDEGYARVVDAQLNYSPDNNKELSTISDISNFALGLTAIAEVQYATGYKRISRRSASGFVKQVDVEKEFSVPYRAGETTGTPIEGDLRNTGINLKDHTVIDVNVAPGDCYLVLNEVSPIIHEYLKQPLILPEKYREDALKE